MAEKKSTKKSTKAKTNKTKTTKAKTKSGKNIKKGGKLTKSLKAGMDVKVRKGKDKGKVGKVLKFDRKEMKVIVQGINKYVDYKKSNEAPRGEKVFKYMPIPVANVEIAK